MKRHATRPNTTSTKPLMKMRPLVATGVLLSAGFLAAAAVLPFKNTTTQESSAQPQASELPAPQTTAASTPVMTASVQPLQSISSSSPTKDGVRDKPVTHPPFRTSLAERSTQDSNKPPKNQASSPNTFKAPTQADHIKPAIRTEREPSTDHKSTAWVDKVGIRPSLTKTHTIKSGDSMAKIFHQQAINPATLHTIMNLGKESTQLAKLKPGQKVEFALGEKESDKHHPLLGLSIKLNALETLWVTSIPTLATESQPNQQSKPTFQIELEKRDFTKRTSSAKGVIQNSLFLAGQKEGLSEKLIMEMANIFGWDVDFALDIRENDSFSVLYEENMLDGKKHSDGNILAAEFTNAGKTFTAIRFEDANGRAEYYTADGYSLRRAFLRSPVDFARISSHFNLRRRHPILHTIRAHKGVDYAAGRGTPIKAVGDGKVILAGRKGGYGKTVVLQHGQKYTTLYAHMSRYAKGIRTGQRVKQGQIIGYVGSSGLATGPHLHYEFRTNGVHVNPLTVKFPQSAPINKAMRTAFNIHKASILAQLPSSTGETRYAQRENDDN